MAMPIAVAILSLTVYIVALCAVGRYLRTNRRVGSRLPSWFWAHLGVL